MVETTALGAAILAGVGIGLLDINDVTADEITKFAPQIGDNGTWITYTHVTLLDTIVI